MRKKKKANEERKVREVRGGRSQPDNNRSGMSRKACVYLLEEQGFGALQEQV